MLSDWVPHTLHLNLPSSIPALCLVKDHRQGKDTPQHCGQTDRKQRIAIVKVEVPDHDCSQQELGGCQVYFAQVGKTQSELEWVRVEEGVRSYLN